MIDSTHPQYQKYLSTWIKILNVVKIENLEQYLRYLNITDTSPENKARNAEYTKAAIFYALTTQTVIGMLGLMFKKAAVLTVPTSMEYMSKNVDGRGNSITQQSQSASKDVVSISRGGLYTTFPATNGAVSKADITSGKAVARIQYVSAIKAINWDENTEGSESKLSLVVFADAKTEVIDREHVTEETIRELFIDVDGFYSEIVHTKSTGNYVAGPVVTPTDYNGNKLTEIPFTFLGATNNDTDVDVPNMLAMTDLNIGHYRNSADYEDSVWYVGQAQPWMSGVTDAHITLMKKHKMYSGSRTLLAVPTGETFAYASAEANPMVRQAMLDKVDMMVGIGAMQLTSGGVAKTAEQSGNEKSAQHSTLSLIASNVSDGYTRALHWAAAYMEAKPDYDNISYTINQDFIDPNTTPAQMKEIIVGFITGAVPVGDYIQYMKDAGIFDEDKSIEDYVSDIDTTSV